MNTVGKCDKWRHYTGPEHWRKCSQMALWPRNINNLPMFKAWILSTLNTLIKYLVMSRPAISNLLVRWGNEKPSYTGQKWVTPSPESTTTPVTRPATINVSQCAQVHDYTRPAPTCNNKCFTMCCKFMITSAMMWLPTSDENCPKMILAMFFNQMKMTMCFNEVANETHNLNQIWIRMLVSDYVA